MHAYSHSHRTNSVVLSFFHELFQPRGEAPARPIVEEPERPTRSGSFLRTGSILVATKPKRSDLSARETLRGRLREQNGWLSWILCATSLSFLSRTRGTVLDPFDHRRSLFTYFFFHVTGLLLRFVLTQRHENRGALLRRLTQRLKSVDVRRHGQFGCCYLGGEEGSSARV